MTREMWEGNQASPKLLSRRLEAIWLRSPRKPGFELSQTNANSAAPCRLKANRRHQRYTGRVCRCAGDVQLIQPGRERCWRASLILPVRKSSRGRECRAAAQGWAMRTLQGDYNQAVHGGGHGDYFPIVLARFRSRGS
jgi:hypothetical protein